MPPHTNYLPLIHAGQTAVAIIAVFAVLIFLVSFAAIGSTWLALLHYVVRVCGRRRRVRRAVVVSDVIEGTWRPLPNQLFDQTDTNYPPAQP